MAFCWHTWKVFEKEILPSALEQLSEAGAEEIEGRINMFRKPCIVTCRCEKCGAEKVERI